MSKDHEVKKAHPEPAAVVHTPAPAVVKTRAVVPPPSAAPAGPIRVDGADYASAADLGSGAVWSSDREFTIGQSEYVLQERGTPMVYRRVR